MNRKQIYKVAIIGSGRIGSSFDSPKSKNILSHAHAFSNNKRTELVALVDIDSERGKREAKKWKTNFYSDIKEMFLRESPDLVVIATPDETHIPILELVTQLKPKLIICEKPIQQSYADGARLQKVPINIPIIINYRRRFDPAVVKLREDILNERLGKIICATGYYSGGLLHNGSHMIDLARYLFGEMKSHVAGRIAVFEKCPQVYLAEGDARAYSIFELDILTEKGRIRFVDEGFFLEKQKVMRDPVFEGFQMLGKYSSEKTKLIHSMENLARHSVAILDGKESSVSSLQNALETESACFQLQNHA